MSEATAAVSPLRRRMINDMSLRKLSPATQRSYLHAVTKFSRYFGRSPDRLGLENVRAFRVYLVSQGISWPALNQTVCALRFFYSGTLDRGELPERIVYARTPRKLPTILSADEVVRFLEAVPSLKASTPPPMPRGCAPRRRSSRWRISTATESRSATARVPRIARSCCHRSCSGFCGFTGGWHARRTGCSPDEAPSRSTCRSFTRPAAPRPRRQAWSSR